MRVDPIILLNHFRIKFYQEYKFHPERKWRFDFAIDPEGYKIAIEIEGGTYIGGRHTRGKGYANDCEKYSSATVLGWSVLRYTTGQLLKNPEIFITHAKSIMERKDNERENMSSLQTK